MARTIKRGLDYFPFDVDFFQDIRIRKLIKYQGGKAVTVYALLLCTIYKNGYYAEWDKELPFIISEQSGYTEAYIQEVIDCCLNIGLLSKDLFESAKVLTSKGIQERYRRICSSARRTCAIAEYNLIPAEGKDRPQPPQKTTEKPEKPQKPQPPKEKTVSPSPTLCNPLAPAPTVQKYSSSIDDEVAEMKKSMQWKESVCIRYQLSNAQVDAYLADFALKCDKQHTSLQDAKSHFCYWLQKQKKDESQAKKTPANGASGLACLAEADRLARISEEMEARDDASRRRATAAQPPDDYIRSLGYDPAEVSLPQALRLSQGLAPDP